MWLIEFCENIGDMSQGGKNALLIMTLIAFICLGSVFYLLEKLIDKIGPSDGKEIAEKLIEKSDPKKIITDEIDLKKKDQ